jgi:hypothetical protein
MVVTLLGFLSADAMLYAYHTDRKSKKRQLHKRLKFLQMEMGWREVSPLLLATLVSVRQHRD